MTHRAQTPGGDTHAGLIDTLVELSRAYGSDPTFVLAGGGNTSAKTDDTLYVKASGHALATIGPDGFVAMDRHALRRLAAGELGDDPVEREKKFKAGVYAARLQPERDQRPSVECLLHELIPERFVVHTHSTLVNALACCDAGEAITRELFGDEVLWVGYVDPGYTLARTICAALDKRAGQARPFAIIMQNHGLILGGETAEEIRAKTDRIVGAIRERLAAATSDGDFGTGHRIEAGGADDLLRIIAPALRGLLAERETLKVVTFDDSESILNFVCSSRGPAATQLGPITPDQIVYCGSFPTWFDPDSDDDEPAIIEQLRGAIAEHKEMHNATPRIVVVNGVGLFAVGDTYAAAENARAVYADAISVMTHADRLGNIHPMASMDRRFIEEWEVESYRRNVARKASHTVGRCVGKIAMVTGAAQGVGFEIAQELVEQGACVALADINTQGVRDAADSICAVHGTGRAIELDVDVTDSASVRRAIERVVRTFGGFDLFIANAGVLKAGSVKTQPEEDFDHVTAVNYKGYFLCVQHAAPVLATQHQAKPDTLSDIIQINSKSGLVGSNRNAAYAGSKFGGIGLTQSFALELLEDGIKVNAICPGNFFDGPLWSDPENGLFVQYLRSNKVPGAQTLEDVRRAYEAKIPMGRGCTTADVMKAVYYIIEQQYETGQALPVTGGQTMLR